MPSVWMRFEMLDEMRPGITACEPAEAILLLSRFGHMPPRVL
jgi:hypothetical protein